MLKKLTFCFLLLFYFLLFPQNLKAAGEFVTDSELVYQIDTSGVTRVIQKITLENLFTDLYAISYRVSFDNLEVINPKAFENGEELEVQNVTEDKNTQIDITFDDALVGKGKSRSFELQFDNPSFVQKTGEVWEISVPKLANPESYRNFTMTLMVPLSFGNEAYISPLPNKSFEDGKYRYYYFDKNSVGKTGVTAGFGDFQVFSFTLYYHLENPLNRQAYTEIAIPPDTATQKLYYQVIDPKPESISLDADGNWIAKYILKSRERIDVKALGQVQIFSSSRPFPSMEEELLNHNLSGNEYWQVEDPEIRKLALELSTPKKIYDYVSSHLQYNYQRVEDATRMGAKEAMARPQDAICTEYTDLFIALARSAGIPAREINGYAYTENPDIQPRSLVADVLHAWPEYWDRSKKTWIPIDPTWGSTTGGVDYFNKLDLRHFTFVIHGQDSTKPYPPGSYKLGVNPQKDVFVSFGQLPQERNSQLKMDYTYHKGLPFSSSSITINIQNTGPVALYDKQMTVVFDDTVKEKKNIDVILPFSSYQAEIEIPYSFLGKNTPSTVSVGVEGSEVKVPTSKKQVIIYNLLVIFLVFLFLIFLILIRTGKIKFTFIKNWILKLNAGKPILKFRKVQNK